MGWGWDDEGICGVVGFFLILRHQVSRFWRSFVWLDGDVMGEDLEWSGIGERVKKNCLRDLVWRSCAGSRCDVHGHRS